MRKIHDWDEESCKLCAALNILTGAIVMFGLLYAFGFVRGA